MAAAIPLIARSTTSITIVIARPRLTRWRWSHATGALKTTARNTATTMLNTMCRSSKKSQRSPALAMASQMAARYRFQGISPTPRR
jgi:hypothetical protein